MITIGGFYLEGGIREFQAWSKKMIETLGDGVKPHLDEIWRRSQSKYQPRKVTVLTPNNTTGIDQIQQRIRESMDRSKEQKNVRKRPLIRSILTWGVIIVICVLCFIPPWIFKVNSKGIYIIEPAGPAFVWDPPRYIHEIPDEFRKYAGCQIDLYRLAAELIPCFVVLYFLQRPRRIEVK